MRTRKRFDDSVLPTPTPHHTQHMFYNVVLCIDRARAYESVTVEICVSVKAVRAKIEEFQFSSESRRLSDFSHRGI